MRRTLIVVLACLVLGLPALGGATDPPFPAGPPNDPDYGPGGANPGECDVDTDQWYFYSFIPSCFPTATDPENAAGMSIDKAWSDYGAIGDPGTVVAYMEGGINWHCCGVGELKDKVYINSGELPLPVGSAVDDANGDGRFSVSDYAGDPAVTPTVNGNTVLDPEDLIIAFSDGTDDDGNGYVDDISGWDFMHDTNDPQVDNTGYGHANGQMRQLAAETNNGDGGAGMCPLCMILPVKVGDEALVRTDKWAEGILFAVDSGVTGIVSVTASVAYSNFARAALDLAWQRGVFVANASNDFESTDHTDGMFWPHVLPGNSITAELGRGQGLGRVVKSFRNRSNLTSWGTHAMFSVSSRDGSTSNGTTTVGGVAALLASYGKTKATDTVSPRGSGPGTRLSAAEITQLMIAASSPIDDPTLSYPGVPGASWNLNYGYGRPNVYKAVQMIDLGQIPPVADISAPRWYQWVDPTVQTSVPIEGAVSALRGGSFTYTVEYARGPQPIDDPILCQGTDACWHAITPALPGTHTGVVSGLLATLDLTDPAFLDFATRPFLNTGDRNRLVQPSNEQYAVTIRVTVTNGSLTGTDRRAFYLRHDPDIVGPTWPMYQGASGESSPAIVDLDGDAVPEIVVGNADGFVHAYHANGTELAGWPVRTSVANSYSLYSSTAAYAGLPVPHDPIVSAVAVGDVAGDPAPEVVAAGSDGFVYAWDAAGVPLSGFPVALATGLPAYGVPPPLVDGRNASRGSFASPVLADLAGDAKKEIIQAAFDGHLHAIKGDGTALWTTELSLPQSIIDAQEDEGFDYFRDHKLLATPAVGNVDDDPALEIVEPSTESFGAPGRSDFLPRHVFYVVEADGTKTPHTVDGFLIAYGTGQDFVTEAVVSPQVVDIEGDGAMEIILSMPFYTPVVLNGDGSLRAPLPHNVSASTKPDAVVNFTTTGGFGEIGGRPMFFAPGSGGASLTGLVAGGGRPSPIGNYTRGWDLTTLAPVPGFPRVQMGLSFFAAPAVADVDGIPGFEVITPADSMALHAFSLAGAEALGFPKFVGGWSLWTPAVGNADGDSDVEIAFATREGYLFLVDAKGDPADVDWGHFQGDASNTGAFTP